MLKQRLDSPEEGWQRIASSNKCITFSDDKEWYIDEEYGEKYTWAAGDKTFIAFNFFGTKLRLLAIVWSNRRNYYVYVDGELTICNTNFSNNMNVVIYENENLEDGEHTVLIKQDPSVYDNASYYIGLTAIDIGKDDKIKQDADFPLKISDDTIDSEEKVAQYCSTLIDGERQLLIADKLKSMYISDGNGGYILISKLIEEFSNRKILDLLSEDEDENLLYKGEKIKADGDISEDIINEIKAMSIHNNRDVLDLLSTDGTNLYFNGKNIQKIELPDGQDNYTGTFMNATNGQTYSIGIKSGSKQCEQIVQAWEFEEGSQDVITVLKTFDNREVNNFYYNKENVEFNDNECKIKDSYKLNTTLNSNTELYETKLDKAEFMKLYKISSEVND